jgi:ribonuclease VapC
MIVLNASAIVAIIIGEPERDALTEALERASEITTSPVAVYEATLGLVRILKRSVEDAEADVMEFLRQARAVIQPIQPETTHLAREAFARYGKGRGHPARLGDCFIYTQAQVGGASLLYKGDDFSKTDIVAAS